VAPTAKAKADLSVLGGGTVCRAVTVGATRLAGGEAGPLGANTSDALARGKDPIAGGCEVKGPHPEGAVPSRECGCVAAHEVTTPTRGRVARCNEEDTTELPGEGVRSSGVP
jgi:hypothetical protein